MKKLNIPLFAILCLFVLTGVAVAAEAPEAAPAEAPALDRLGAESIASGDCGQEPTVALGGQEPTSTFSSNCGTCSPSSACVGLPRKSWCFLGNGQGWGTCDIYLGIQCSDGSGWDCACYGSGGGIP